MSLPRARSALVVGGDARIGRALVAALGRAGWAVRATTRRRDPAPPGSRLFLDLAEVAERGCPELPPCDVAFVCAGLTSYAACREDAARTRAINVEGPERLTRTLRGMGARTVLLSTNAVFDGSLPFRKPLDPTDAVTPYGRSKAEAERRLREADPELTILRLTKVVGSDEPLLARWLAELGAGRGVEAFDDMVAAPVALEHVVSALVAIAERDLGGILQLSAKREIRYVEIARHLASRLGVPSERVEAVSGRSRGIDASEAPRHASLDCAEFLPGFGLPPLDPTAELDAALALDPESTASRRSGERT